MSIINDSKEAAMSAQVQLCPVCGDDMDGPGHVEMLSRRGRGGLVATAALNSFAKSVFLGVVIGAGALVGGLFVMALTKRGRSGDYKSYDV